MDAWVHPIYLGSMSVCLNILNFAFVYIDLRIFPEYEFRMLTSEALSHLIWRCIDVDATLYKHDLHAGLASKSVAEFHISIYYFTSFVFSLIWLSRCRYSFYSITVDSRYLEVQGTLWNSSRYRTPTYQICRTEKKIYRMTTFNKWICNLTPISKKIAISYLFHNILLFNVRFPCETRNQIFTSR